MVDVLRPEVRDEAARLGIETTYVDASGVRHAAEPRSVVAVLDVLRDDTAGSARTGQLIPDVIVIGGPDAGAPPDVSSFDDVALTLAHGTVVDRRDVAAELSRLPVGCHRLEVSAGARSAVASVVVAPRQMPSALPSSTGRLPVAVFTPTYGLWSAADPLPGYHHLGKLAADMGGCGCDVVFTLPLYDLFLDDPCEPSPYSPASRQHWNELFVDDAALPGAPLPPGLDGPVLDLPALAARRRVQLLEAAALLEGAPLAELEAFVAERPDVAAYARFRAGPRTGAAAGVPAALVERSYALAQLLAHRHLVSVARSRAAAGIGLDLPIGGHPDGYETWAHPERFAAGFRVGAPPDPLAAGGQDWGFPPQLPGAGRRSGHELWRTLVDRASEHAAVLRLDHVMAVHRLWWIPPGAPATEGVYVRYPAEEILSTIAATAAAHGTAVVGENLGTVPPEVDELLERWKMLGLYEEAFHLADPTPVTIPPHAIAGIRTHDMEPFALAATRPAPAHRPRQGEQLLDVVLRRLARSSAAMVVADIDDLLELTEPHNRPGITGGATWRRRLPIPVEDIVTHPAVRARLSALATTRPSLRSPATEAVAGRSIAGAHSLAPRR